MSTHNETSEYFDSENNQLRLSPDESERLDAAFAAAQHLPSVRTGRCVFCDDAGALKHSNGVWSCRACDSEWIDADDLALLLETDDERDARLAMEFQRAHSSPLWEGESWKS